MSNLSSDEITTTTKSLAGTNLTNEENAHSKNYAEIEEKLLEKIGKYCMTQDDVTHLNGNKSNFLPMAIFASVFSANIPLQLIEHQEFRRYFGLKQEPVCNSKLKFEDVRKQIRLKFRDILKLAVCD